MPVGVRAAPPRCAAASAGTAALARCARQRPGLRPGTRRRTEGALGSVLCPRGCGGPAGPPHRPRRPQVDRNTETSQRGVSVRSKGSRRLPALSKAAKRLEIERLAKKAPVGLSSVISRSEHWNVPKGRFSAEQGKPQASRIVGGRKAAGDRAFDEKSPCGAFFANKPIGTLERPKGAFQCGASSSIFRLYIRSSVITA